MEDILQILGNGMSAKMWEVTIEHARTCALNKESYIYYAPAERRIGVVFNVIGELLGIKMEQQFMPAKILSDSQKARIPNFLFVCFYWESKARNFSMFTRLMHIS